MELNKVVHWQHHVVLNFSKGLHFPFESSGKFYFFHKDTNRSAAAAPRPDTAKITILLSSPQMRTLSTAAVSQIESSPILLDFYFRNCISTTTRLLWPLQRTNITKKNVS